MGLRDLAYKIKTFSQGYYYVWNFHIDGKQLKELNQTLLHENSVLRHLVITVPNEYNFVAVMQDMDKRKGEKAAQLAAE